MSDLICPTCKSGPFPTLKGYKAHLRSHQKVTCPDCGTEVGALGIGSHRRAAHGVVSMRPQAVRDRERRGTSNVIEMAAKAAERRRVSAASDALHDMLGDPGDELIGRLAEFVEKHEPDGDRGLFLVAVPGGAGPWVCPPANVGMVIAREHAAAVVVAVDDINAHLAHQPAAVTR